MIGRSVPEWVAKTPDEKIPPRVRLRIWERYHGICHLTGRKIMVGDKWEMDHIVALTNGGEHRESNLAPALWHAHRAKTRDDVAQKSRVASVKAKHIGLRNKGPNRLRGKGFSKAPKTHWRTDAEMARLHQSGDPA